MFTDLGAIPGTHYRDIPMSVHAAATASAVMAVAMNPFNRKAYVYTAEIVAPAAVTGDNTNRKNFNLQLAGGTEIAALDLATGTDLAAVTPAALVFGGTAAQRTIAEGAGVKLQVEKVGSGVDIPAGTILRVGWRVVGG